MNAYEKMKLSDASSASSTLRRLAAQIAELERRVVLLETRVGKVST